MSYFLVLVPVELVCSIKPSEIPNKAKQKKKASLQITKDRRQVHFYSTTKKNTVALVDALDFHSTARLQNTKKKEAKE